MVAEPRSQPRPTGGARAGATSDSPKPLPKRPKGNYFLGVAFLTVLFISAFAVWNTYFRYNAYGTISGRIIEIPASQAGVVRSIHVRQGEVVSPGQLLATMEDMDAKAELERLRDELVLAQATLDAEMAELSWQSRVREDQTQRTIAEYYESWGTLLKKEAELSNMQLQLKRKEEIVRAVPRVITEEELETLRFALQGKRAKVEKLKVAVEELRRAAKISGPEEGPSQLKPHLSRIKNLQAEIARARERLELLDLRSPVRGRVTRTRFFAGEYVPSAAPVLEILEDGSLEAVLYLPQRMVGSYAKGDIIELHVVANAEELPAEVTGFGEQMVAPPPALERYYRSNQTLLEVHARPYKRDDAGDEKRRLRLGSEIRLRNTWTKRSAASRIESPTDKRQVTEAGPHSTTAPEACQAKPLVHYQRTDLRPSEPIQNTAYETAISRTNTRLRRSAADGPGSQRVRRLPPDPCP